MWLWLLTFATSTLKQRAYISGFEPYWLWNSGYTARESWLVSTAVCDRRIKASPEPQHKRQKRHRVNHLRRSLAPASCLVSLAASCSWAVVRRALRPVQPSRTPLINWQRRGPDSEDLMPSPRCVGGVFWTAKDREVKQHGLGAVSCHPAQVHMDEPLRSTQHGMGWEPEGGYSWGHGTAHPSTEKVKSSVNVRNLLFLITQHWKALLS